MVENEVWDFKWSPTIMLEVTLPDPDQFLKIRETLTRIGISSKRDNTLFQTCHILHKKGKYYIVNFLELFALDGKETTLGYEDIGRRNTIASLLESWGLCKVLQTPMYLNNRVSVNQIKIVPYAEKRNWQLIAKYTVGKFCQKKPQSITQ